jgi:ectoine hydroxylase-related dioxygenase (phytanoyl-CoA dioxygenase family)
LTSTEPTLFPGIPLVESPEFETRFRDADPETRKIAEDLHRDGHAVFDFPRDDFATIAEELVAVLGPHFHQQTELINVWKPEWSWSRASYIVRAIATNARVVDLLSRLFGRRAFPFQTLNFRVGTEKRAHSDSAHFSSVPERFMCAVWVAFEDVREDGGPLFYYPGSHRLPILTNEHLGLGAPVDDAGYERFENAWEAIAAAEGLERRRFLARRGQAVIWLANLLHGGEAIRDPSTTRHSQATHYFFEECRYWTPLHSDPMRGTIAWREPTGVQ